MHAAVDLLVFRALSEPLQIAPDPFCLSFLDQFLEVLVGRLREPRLGCLLFHQLLRDHRGTTPDGCLLAPFGLRFRARLRGLRGTGPGGCGLRLALTIPSSAPSGIGPRALREYLDEAVWVHACGIP